MMGRTQSLANLPDFFFSLKIIVIRIGGVDVGSVYADDAVVSEASVIRKRG